MAFTTTRLKHGRSLSLSFALVQHSSVAMHVGRWHLANLALRIALLVALVSTLSTPGRAASGPSVAAAEQGGPARIHTATASAQQPAPSEEARTDQQCATAGGTSTCAAAVGGGGDRTADELAGAPGVPVPSGKGAASGDGLHTNAPVSAMGGQEPSRHEQLASGEPVAGGQQAPAAAAAAAPTQHSGGAATDLAQQQQQPESQQQQQQPAETASPAAEAPAPLPVPPEQEQHNFALSKDGGCCTGSSAGLPDGTAAEQGALPHLRTRELGWVLRCSFPQPVRVPPVCDYGRGYRRSLRLPPACRRQDPGGQQGGQEGGCPAG